VKNRMNMQAMIPRDQMLVLLGKISSTIDLSETTCLTRRSGQTIRKHQRTHYLHECRRVCRDTFKFLHGISQDRLTSLIKWYKTEGLVPKEKNVGGRKTTGCLTYEDIENIVRFLTNYAALHAMVLPGRVHGFKRDDIKLLPSSHTSAHVYKEYKVTVEKNGNRVAGKSSFRRYWRELLPFIVTSKPMTDLCWTCQRNNTLIYRSANTNEDEKS